MEGRLVSSDKAVSISYYRTYALYYLGTDRDDANDKMTDLYVSTKSRVDEQDRLSWSLPTLAFAFSARIYASMQSEHGNRQESLEILYHAVQRLMSGDRECCTRALMLCQIATRWARRWNMVDQAHFQRSMIDTIKDRIVLT